jgi:predicted phosphodiesterase
MRIQLLSDLHLETETLDLIPNPGAEVLVLAGDIDATWAALSRFEGWPVPVLFVPGNHEFDQRDVDQALQDLRARCEALGLHWLDRESVLLTGDDGRLIRFLGTTRWSDFDLLGTSHREKAMRAGHYFTRVQQSLRYGKGFDVEAIREAGLADRAWLEVMLSEGSVSQAQATVVVTHFAPSIRSADPRFGRQPGTASFCNADDDLIERADLWLHGHLHCRHDYVVPRLGRSPARVVCHARGLARKGEADGWRADLLIQI